GGVPVSVDELRRVLGESVVQLVLTNGEAVVDVVNLHRKPTVAQRIAKLFTDSCCTAEGCDRAARLEFDHRHDWARVQTTELANLDLLCDHHHDLKTYEGWQLVDGTGRRPMVPPSDTRHPNGAGAGAGAEAGAVAGDAGGAGRTARRSDDAGPPAGPPVGGDRPGAADLVERLEKIRAREAERRARNSGQDSLFDTG
ncbi:MAG: HNH endonuclease, partial [Microthrixaceae bacterium]|nr:HNH endonuclease [Microthrixaceae bacterium]